MNDQTEWKMLPAVKSVASDAELLGYLDDLIAAQGYLMFAKDSFDDQHAQDFGVGLMDFMRLHGLRLRQIVADASLKTQTS